MPRLLILLLFCLACLAGCVQPQLQAHAVAAQQPQLQDGYAVMADGYRLPVTETQPAGSVRSIILALHGFNDYRNAFRAPADFFARHGVMTVAYDQRGFGATEQRGLWPGTAQLADDAATLAGMLCARYPGVPLFLLGESMGGAVVLETAPMHMPECVRGVILVAPAVWGWSAMPWWQALLLRAAAHIVPGKTVTAEGLDITPSDNIEMLRALGRDPLVIKATRIDTIYGLTNLMEAASRLAAQPAVPVLLLYGERDEIVPAGAMCDLLERVDSSGHGAWRMVLYAHGYHMLMRDLQAGTVLGDVLAWLADPAGGLPSGETVQQDSQRLRELCRKRRRYSAG